MDPAQSLTAWKHLGRSAGGDRQLGESDCGAVVEVDTTLPANESGGRRTRMPRHPQGAEASGICELHAAWVGGSGEYTLRQWRPVVWGMNLIADKCYRPGVAVTPQRLDGADSAQAGSDDGDPVIITSGHFVAPWTHTKLVTRSC